MFKLDNIHTRIAVIGAPTQVYWILVETVAI